MIFLINFFKFFQLTIQKPEISLQPHILKNEKHIKESGDKEITLFNNVKNIEFIINFKTYDILDCYSSIRLQEYGTLSLISYDVIKENTSLKITNKMKDKSFKFIFKENYLISNIKEDIFEKVFTLISCENSSEKSFYNYILENKNKAWRIIINLYNKNTECNHKLKTSVFKLHKSKIKFEIFKDSLLPIISVIPDNSPSS